MTRSLCSATRAKLHFPSEPPVWWVTNGAADYVLINAQRFEKFAPRIIQESPRVGNNSKYCKFWSTQVLDNMFLLACSMKALADDVFAGAVYFVSCLCRSSFSVTKNLSASQGGACPNHYSAWPLACNPSAWAMAASPSASIHSHPMEWPVSSQLWSVVSS